MSAALISARTILVGVDENGALDLRHDAHLRIDNGKVVQIGAWEAVAYGNDSLPRYGGPDLIALPAACAESDFARGLASEVVTSTALRSDASLRPGSPADLVLFDAQGEPRLSFRAGVPY